MGDIDALSASRNDDKIAWYENTNGDGTSWTARTITTGADRARSVFAADVDGDGDIDALSASYDDQKIAWYENTNGDGTSWAARTIATATTSAVRSVFAADVDGDGDIDALSASIGTAGSNDKIAWYENKTIHRSATFPDSHSVSSTASPLAVVSGDLDLNGEEDLVVAFGNGTIFRILNPDLESGSFSSQSVGGPFAELSAIALGDIDGDGVLDLVGASSASSGAGFYNQSIFWCKNSGSGSFNNCDASAFEVADVSQMSGVNALALADVNGDGTLDVVAANENTVDWFSNDGSGTFAYSSASYTVIVSQMSGVNALAMADVNGDGTLDAVVGFLGSDRIDWFENLNGAGTSWLGQNITTNAGDPGAVNTGDIDGDGDLDVLAALYAAGAVRWYENVDTSGSANSWSIGMDVTTDAPQPQDLFVGDLDVDGDLDVGVAGSVLWAENDGSGNFSAPDEGPPNSGVISTDLYGANSIIAVDLDNDGDLDVVATAPGAAISGTVFAFENKGGQFALATTDTAPALIGNGQEDDLLRIEMTHRGRSGDSDAELRSLNLRFEGSSGGQSLDPLKTGQVNAIIDELRLYLDDGDGSFEPGGDDTLVHTFETLNLDDEGDMTFTIRDDTAAAQVPFGTPSTFFLSTLLTADAFSQSPNIFTVTHLTESSSRGEDATADIPISLEFADNKASSAVPLPDLLRFVFVRELPRTYTPDDEFRVSIFVFRASGSFNYDVTDTVPAGWTVSDISDGGTETGGVVSWTGLAGSFTGNGLSYSVTPPAAAVGEVCFSGEGVISGILTIPMVGDDCVRLVIQETFAAWAARNGVAAIQTGAGSDPDGDGDENLLEFAFGTNPNDPGSRVIQRTLKVDPNGVLFPLDGSGGQITCRYNRSKSAGGITYVVESAIGGPVNFLPLDDSDNPAALISDSKIGEGPGTLLREVVIDVPAGVQAFFVRIRVTVP